MFLDMIEGMLGRKEIMEDTESNRPSLLATKEVNYIIADIWEQREFKTFRDLQL